MQLSNFILLKSSADNAPPIFYLPAKHNDATLALLEASSLIRSLVMSWHGLAMAASNMPLVLMDAVAPGLAGRTLD
jgi:hypothetical protein